MGRTVSDEANRRLAVAEPIATVGLALPSIDFRAKPMTNNNQIGAVALLTESDDVVDQGPVPFARRQPSAGARTANDAADCRSDSEVLWDRLEPAIGAVKFWVHRVDSEAIRRGEASSESLKALTKTFAICVRLLDEVLGDQAGAPTNARQAVGARVQTELLPYMLMSGNAERWYSKPRGYAGDYLSIARIYEDHSQGSGRVGPILDRCFLDMPAVRAVQNRRALIAAEILATVASRPEKPVRVASLACGPAIELFDVYRDLPDPGALRSTLIDLDLSALADVSDRRDRVGLKGHMALVNEDLIRLAAGRRAAPCKEQDLVYSIGLIDYFSDGFVVRLLNFVHSILRKGGRVLLGNFHPRNSTKALMDYVLDWKLVHRTEEDMNRLFEASLFGQPCSRILFENERINLFAECYKS
jgi:hypothetical protein